MKAERIHAFGGPQVMQLEDIPMPSPGRDELLVRVHAAGVNPSDWKRREGKLGPLALPAVLGRDYSGVVEAIGNGVTDFHVGDAVFGVAATGSGSFAEYLLARPSESAKTPPGLDHLHAAALPVSALTAWQTLFDTADLQAGQSVLVHGAAGGVGCIAVQLARWKGAHVIGTASSDNLDLVHGLGADEVVDYRTTRFEDVVHDVDVVLDTIGGETQDRSWRVLRRGGILVSIVQATPAGKPASYGVRGVFVVERPRGDELARIADLVASGQLRLNIATVLPLSEARKALELSESHHARGKIVIAVADARD